MAGFQHLTGLDSFQPFLTPEEQAGAITIAIKLRPGAHNTLQQHDAAGVLDLIIALVDKPDHRLEYFLGCTTIRQHHI